MQKKKETAFSEHSVECHLVEILGDFYTYITIKNPEGNLFALKTSEF